MNTTSLREAENVSSTRKLNKGMERNVLRNKTNTLGDVQNTIHSRASNFVNPTINSAKKGFTKAVAKENVLSTTTPKLGKKTNIMTDHFSSKMEADMLDMHNHFLCEQAAQDSVSDYLLQYKFTEEQIETLVKRVKNKQIPVAIPSVEPCADIEISTYERPEEKGFLVSDIFSDLVLPEVPAPVV